MMATKEPEDAPAEAKASPVDLPTDVSGGLTTSAATLARLQDLPDAPGVSTVHLAAPPRGASEEDSERRNVRAQALGARQAPQPARNRTQAPAAAGCRATPAMLAPAPQVVPVNRTPPAATVTAPIPGTSSAPPAVHLPAQAGGASATSVMPPSAPPAVTAPELPPEDATRDAEVPTASADGVDLGNAVLWPTAEPTAAAAPPATHATAKVGRPASSKPLSPVQAAAPAPAPAAAVAPARRRSFFQTVASTAVRAGRAVERASVAVVKGLDNAADAVFSRVESASNKLMGTQPRPIPADVGVPISERIAAAEAAAGIGPPRALPVADDEAPPESADGEPVLYGTPVYDQVYVAPPAPVAAAAPAPAPAPSVGSHIKGFFTGMASETARLAKDIYKDAAEVTSPSYIFGMQGSRAPVPTNAGMATAGAGNYAPMTDTDDTGAGAGAGAGGAQSAGADDTVHATPVGAGGGAGNDVTIRPLPPGWEWAFDQHHRVYFINHNDRTTTYDDPRDR